MEISNCQDLPDEKYHEKDIDYREYIQQCKKEKLDCISKYCNQYLDLPKQGDADWLALRPNNFGGSELATILGANKYKTWYSLMCEKVGVGAAFEGNTYCDWGTLFEPVLRQIWEIKCDTVFNELSSIPWKEEGFRYSPDGIACVSYEKMCDMFGADAIDIILPYYIILFELKSPACRVIDGTIPDHYSPQIKSGMCVINIADYGIYTEGVFRRCSFDDLHMDNNRYTPSFPGKSVTMPNPMAIGVIVLYTKNIDLYRELNAKHRVTTPADVDAFIDFGKCASDSFFHVIRLWKSKQINIEFIMQGSDDLAIHGNEENGLLVGIIPWKLFDLSMHLVHNDQSYLPSHWPIVKTSVDILRECNGKSVAEKQIFLKSHVKNINKQKEKLKMQLILDKFNRQDVPSSDLGGR